VGTLVGGPIAAKVIHIVRAIAYHARVEDWGSKNEVEDVEAFVLVLLVAVGEEKEVVSIEVPEWVHELYSRVRGIDFGEIEGGSGNRVA